MGKTSATNPPGPGSPLTPTGRNYEVKASTLRAYMAQIAKLGVLPEVMAKVHADTRRSMEAPPLPSVWIDGLVIEDMISALESLRGIEAVRTVTREGHGAVGLPILKPIVTGLLRVFGGSPNTLFSRWPDITKTALRGVTFQWVLDTPTSGRLTVTFPRKNVPRSAYVGMESGCWLVLDLCGAKGTVAATELANEGSTGTIHVHW
jgi:hypothetical protein